MTQRLWSLLAALALAVAAAAIFLGTGRDAAPASTFVLLDGSTRTTADLQQLLKVLHHPFLP